MGADPATVGHSDDLPAGATHSIGATLEQVRLNHRIHRLTKALQRLERIAEESVTAGQPVPTPLQAALGVFNDELATARRTLARLSTSPA